MKCEIQHFNTSDLYREVTQCRLHTGMMRRAKYFNLIRGRIKIIFSNSITKYMRSRNPSISGRRVWTPLL